MKTPIYPANTNVIIEDFCRRKQEKTTKLAVTKYHIYDLTAFPSDQANNEIYSDINHLK